MKSQSRPASLEGPVDSKQRGVGDPRDPASLGAFTGLRRGHLGMVRVAEHFESADAVSPGRQVVVTPVSVTTAVTGRAVINFTVAPLSRAPGVLAAVVNTPLRSTARMTPNVITFPKSPASIRAPRSSPTSFYSCIAPLAAADNPSPGGELTGDAGCFKRCHPC